MVRRSDFENGVRLFAIRTAAFLMMFIGQLLVCTSGEQVLQCDTQWCQGFQVAVFLQLSPSTLWVFCGYQLA